MVCFRLWGLACIADVSSVSPSSEQTVKVRKHLSQQNILRSMVLQTANRETNKF